MDRVSHLSVGVVNPAKIVGMRRDARWREEVTVYGVVLADGQSAVWAGRRHAEPAPALTASADYPAQRENT